MTGDSELLKVLRAAQLRAIRNGKLELAEYMARCIAKVLNRIGEDVKG
jgi:hypothetical protein